MIISQDNDLGSSVVLRATFDAYDGYPISDSFVVDSTSKHYAPDYLGLAGYLVFGRWASGAISFPAPIMPELAGAIEHDSYPVRIRPQGIELAPKRIKTGHLEVSVNLSGETCSATGVEVQILPRGFNRGFLRSSRLIQVSSNAFLFATAKDRWLSHRPILAAVLLACNDLELGRIVIQGDMDRQEIDALQSLFMAVGIEIVIRP